MYTAPFLPTAQVLTLYAAPSYSAQVLLFFSQRGVSLYAHCYFAPDALCPWGDFPATGGVDPLAF